MALTPEEQMQALRLAEEYPERIQQFVSRVGSFMVMWNSLSPEQKAAVSGLWGIERTNDIESITADTLTFIAQVQADYPNLLSD